MRYFALYYYTEKEKKDEYAVQEMILTEPQFRAYQKAYNSGQKSVMFADRQIAISSVKEVLPADDIVREYRSMGISLPNIGLPEVPEVPSLPEGENKKKIENQERYRKMLEDGGFGKQMDGSPSH